jgi:hypothetical protein
MHTSPAQYTYPPPFPQIQTVIEVLWDSKQDWWRVGTIVAWNEKARRHEVAYQDEPGEEPVLELFWGARAARYRYFGTIHFLIFI